MTLLLLNGNTNFAVPIEPRSVKSQEAQMKVTIIESRSNISTYTIYNANEKLMFQS